MSREPGKKKKIRVFSKFLCFISFIVLVLFLIMLYLMKVLPMKYYVLIACILGVMELIYILTCFNKRIKSFILVLMAIIAIPAIIAEGYGTWKLYQAYDFLNNDMQVQETTDLYYVVVNSNSGYTDLKSIEGKKVYYFNDSEDYKKVKTNVMEKVSVVLVEEEEYSSLLDEVLANKDKIILIDESSYDAYFETLEDENGTNNTTTTNDFRILERFEVISEVAKSDSTKNITEEPFIIYLSGIDTRKNKMPKKNLSDVNMFIVVNPKTRKILLVNVPRDYYVQLHGTKGLKDKLTHAGMRGGVQLSKATMEDLLGNEADYYVRVNFQAVVKLVDAIGGITINSEDNYSYTLLHGRQCKIKPGINKLDGKCAIAYARERYAYRTGDRHRGENQQRIIKAVVDKLSSSKSLMTNYDKILKSLEGSFESNLSTQNITSLVQFQLDDMRGWNFETKNVTGSNGYEPCYSFPKGKLAVMYQDSKSINAAKDKIKEVLEEK